LFGSNHGIETYAVKNRCYVQESAFAQPQAYIGVYQDSPT
jgi:5-methylcytosine-specific restriction protein B